MSCRIEKINDIYKEVTKKIYKDIIAIPDVLEGDGLQKVKELDDVVNIVIADLEKMFEEINKTR